MVFQSRFDIRSDLLSWFFSYDALQKICPNTTMQKLFLVPFAARMVMCGAVVTETHPHHQHKQKRFVRQHLHSVENALIVGGATVGLAAASNSLGKLRSASTSSAHISNSDAGNGNNNGTTGAAGTSTPGTGLRDI